jgi:hypothetical protein
MQRGDVWLVAHEITGIEGQNVGYAPSSHPRYESRVVNPHSHYVVIGNELSPNEVSRSRVGNQVKNTLDDAEAAVGLSDG